MKREKGEKRIEDGELEATDRGERKGGRREISGRGKAVRKWEEKRCREDGWRGEKGVGKVRKRELGR